MGYSGYRLQPMIFHISQIWMDINFPAMMEKCPRQAGAGVPKVLDDLVGDAEALKFIVDHLLVTGA